MSITNEIVIHASAAKVWETVGTNFYNISHWNSQVLESIGENNPDVGRARVCKVREVGSVNEHILRFDNTNYSLSYKVTAKKMPFFLKYNVASWSVNPIDDNTSKVIFIITPQLIPVFKQLLYKRLCKRLSKGLSSVLIELKQHVESMGL